MIYLNILLLTVQTLNTIFMFNNCTNMVKKPDPDQFNVLRKIQNNPNATQRKLASDLEMSLGKLNYCLRALRAKGLIKMSNFAKNKNKLNYIYLLTPKGISEKAKLTMNFMKLKMKEYEELKKEIEK